MLEPSRRLDEELVELEVLSIDTRRSLRPTTSARAPFAGGLQLNSVTRAGYWTRYNPWSDARAVMIGHEARDAILLRV